MDGVVSMAMPNLNSKVNDAPLDEYSDEDYEKVLEAKVEILFLPTRALVIIFPP